MKCMGNHLIQMFGIVYDFENMVIKDVTGKIFHMQLDNDGVLCYVTNYTGDGVYLGRIPHKEVVDAYRKYQEHLVEKFLLEHRD